MGRGTVATIGGLVAFGLYLVLVLELAAVATGHHWTLDLVYFAAAGMLWSLPAARLLRWVHAGRPTP